MAHQIGKGSFIKSYFVKMFLSYTQSSAYVMQFLTAREEIAAEKFAKL